MTLQQLHYFRAAVEHGSFSAAATVLHVAQPSLAEPVRRLEAELGVALFHRVGRGLTPTEAGRTLRDHAVRVLDAADAARDAVAGVREVRSGTATFGTWGTSRYYGAAEIAATFAARHPGVGLRIVGQNSSEVVATVAAGAIEAAVIALPIDDRGLDVRPVMRDELVFASTDPAQLRAPMTIERLARATLVLPEASWGLQDPTRHQLSELAQRAGVRLAPAIDVEDQEAAIELAGQGLADTWVARGMLLGIGDRVPEALGWVPFAEPVYDTFAFITRTGASLSPATRELLSIAEDHLRALEKRLRHEPPRRRRPGG